LVTFAISGLWHGAKWTYVVWGALNGVFLIAGVFTEEARRRLRRQLGLEQYPRIVHAAQVGVTFLLVLVGWVFFRADSVAQGLYVLRHWFVLAPGAPNGPVLSPADVNWSLALVGALAFVEWWLQDRPDPLMAIRETPAWFRWTAYYGVAAVII